VAAYMKIRNPVIDTEYTPRRVFLEALSQTSMMTNMDPKVRRATNPLSSLFPPLIRTATAWRTLRYTELYWLPGEKY